MSGIAGKVAFVTGGGGGIGRATALKLAAAGARVMVFDRDQDALAATVREAEGRGGIMTMSVGDVSVQSDVRLAVAETVQRFGRLDVAHNNAGVIGVAKALADYPLEAFQRVIDVNLMGVLHCLQAEIPCMLAGGGGAIVNTTSVVGKTALPDICAYVTSKHALVGLTKAAALEYASKGIRINCVSPGYVITNMTAEFFTEESRKAFESLHPIGRASRPEEIASAVLWLLSDEASYAIGADLVMDGGYTLL
jgi:NAD(P)-dependent dehydrogenase (short-subunit alcohol dehydrogenase family)